MLDRFPMYYIQHLVGSGNMVMTSKFKNKTCNWEKYNFVIQTLCICPKHLEVFPKDDIKWSKCWEKMSLVDHICLT